MKTAADLTRARLAVQNSHSYFTRALKICDGIRGTATNRALLGAFGGDGIGEMSKMSGYRGAIFLKLILRLACSCTDIQT